MPAIAPYQEPKWEIRKPWERTDDRGYLQLPEDRDEPCDEPEHKASRESIYGSVSKKWTIIPAHSSAEEAKFTKLRELWRKETGHHSSLAKISFNPAYQAILAMGKEALPFILKDLERELDHWFYALSLIAGEDKAAGATTMDEARIMWLEWGKNEGYLK